jgi:hypothetical protein
MDQLAAVFTTFARWLTSNESRPTGMPFIYFAYWMAIQSIFSPFVDNFFLCLYLQLQYNSYEVKLNCYDSTHSVFGMCET